MQHLVVAVAQERESDAVAGAETGVTTTNEVRKADGALSLGLTGERRPLYRLRQSDVLEVNFTFTPEWNQTVSVLPDGFVVLRSAGNLLAEGQTLPELTASIRQAYSNTLRPGDLVFVPQNTISKIRRYMPLPNLGMYVNPTQF
jgi:protein involved in polysaccharide export with SLBB domain